MHGRIMGDKYGFVQRVTVVIVLARYMQLIFFLEIADKTVLSLQ